MFHSKSRLKKWEVWMPQDSLNYPPFPPLKWDDFFWVGDVVLPSWAGFQSRRGAYGAASSQMASNGIASLSIYPVDRGARSNPMLEQVAAYQQLLENEAKVADAVIRALVEYCPGHAYDGDDEDLLNVNQPAQLRPLIGLSSLHILKVVHHGMACIGFEFGCAWDEEHGAGVMTHNGRVIATGQADCSFVEWIARQGLGK
jgi:hypothetical protein